MGLPVTSSLPLLIGASAAAYAVAMIALKLWVHDGASPVLVALVVGAFVVAAVAELAALREARLGMIYVLILGVECVIIAGASALYFGETFTARELAGAALIVAGTALASV